MPAIDDAYDIRAQANALADVQGGSALIDWLGFVPSFHDAELVDIELSSKRSGRLRFHAFRMTDRTDDQGYYILDRHVLVTLTLEDVSEVALTGFNLIGIVSYLVITKAAEGYCVQWDSSFGVEGMVVAKHALVEFEEWRPEPAFGAASRP